MWVIKLSGILLHFWFIASIKCKCYVESEGLLGTDRERKRINVITYTFTFTMVLQKEMKFSMKCFAIEILNIVHVNACSLG